MKPKSEHDPLVLFIEIAPKPAPRPRPGRFGVYYGADYEHFVDELRHYARTVSTGFLDPPIEMEVFFIYERPKSHAREDEPQWHTQRGDLDNLIKGVKDAFNGVLYRDDGDVCKETLTKIFAPTRDWYGIVVLLRTIKEPVLNPLWTTLSELRAKTRSMRTIPVRSGSVEGRSLFERRSPRSAS